MESDALTTQLMTPISANLRRLRGAANLTQQALATGAGLSVSIVCQIEQGVNLDPRGSTLSALARVLKVTVDELLREPEVKPADVDDKPAARKGRRKKG